TAEVVASAAGGVLFIDEAYSLTGIPGMGGIPNAVSTSDSTQPPPAAPPTAPPPAPPRTLEELLAELDGLIGLRGVKREIHRQVALLRVEKLRVDAGLKSPTMTRHLVFTGNPGTGKTTVARLVGGIYQALGLLSGGHLVEVDRSELVAGYLGQTATKTAEVVASAAGGVLFIDEAYSLTGTGPAGDQYGQESVDTLVKEMEDRRDDLVVIVAGYPDPMAAFIAANPGLASRFRTTIEFEDYTDDELLDILRHLAKGADYELEPEAEQRFREVLGRTPRGSSFGNGRYARNALEAAIGHHAWRLRDTAEPTLEQLRLLVARDFDEEPLDEGAEMTPAASDREPAAAPPHPVDRTTDPGGTS
ncbi:MAG: AAA family ATPase, partial [Ornithinibacter sp.]